MTTERGVRRAALGAALVLVSVPFLVVTFPPSTDLPQHVAQIRLFREAWGGTTQYQVNWLAPNNLVYLLMGGLSTALGPLQVGRATLLVLAWAWVASLAWLAARRDRSWEAATVGAALIFHASLYWGFVNFLTGWPVFVLWVGLTADPATPPRLRTHTALLAVVALLLYAAHVLWFAMGAAWLVLVAITTRPARPLLLARGAALLPPVALAARWYHGFAAARAGFDVEARWFTPPWRRVLPGELLEAALGGVRGPLEIVVGLMLLLWTAATLLAGRRRRSLEWDRALLTGAALLGGFALLAPDKYMNTLSFASRWVAPAIALMLLALPAPRARPRLRAACALGMLGVFSVGTAFVWRSFETRELAGLREAIEASPSGASVLGLDLIKQSRFIEGWPFAQMPGYVQALHGGEINFSFAEHGSSIVSYRTPRPLPWTVGLEFYGERATLMDALMFEVVLVNATPAVHDQVVRALPITPITRGKRWRLYRVVRLR